MALARLLRRAHEVVLNGLGTPPVLRDVIVSSWERCTAAGVDPDRPAPIMLNADEAAERFAAHPLAEVAPLVRSLLSSVSEEARHLVAISDVDATLLWADGHPRMLEAALAPHFRPGALCSEAAVGTNAVGTALALGHPVQIFSAEHFNRLLHGWTCAAAPVRDPATGVVLGVIDLSSSFRNAHPHTLALVTAVAKAAETRLERGRALREAELMARYMDRLPAGGRRPSALLAADGRVLASTPRRWLGRRFDVRTSDGRVVLPDGSRAVVEPLDSGARIVWGTHGRRRGVPRRVLRIRALGADPAELRFSGAPLPVTNRQGELLVVLALAPAGLTAHALAEGLFGPGAKPVTARAEVARIRRVVGELIGAQPYRLAADIDADFLRVERHLSRHRIAAAVDEYAGPLLPGSRAPAIVARRAALDKALRRAVADDPELRRRWQRKLRARRCNPSQPRVVSRRPARPLGC